MSRRYTNRRWYEAPLLAAQLYGCKRRLQVAEAARAALQAERAAFAEDVADLAGANAALIREVNTLRAVVGLAQVRRDGLIAELALARKITGTQAGIIAHQGTELIAAYAALGAVFHMAPADLAWAQQAVQAVIIGKDNDHAAL